MEPGTEVCLEGRRGIAGDWQGTVGEQKRRVVMRIATADEGGWKATFHPIDQTAQPQVRAGRSRKLPRHAVLPDSFAETGSFEQCARSL